MPRIPVLSTPCFLTLLLGAACATAGPPPTEAPEALLSETGHAAPACSVVTEPAILPAPEALVDLATLEPAVTELWAAAELDPGYVLLSLHYQADGLNIRRNVIEHSTPLAVADSVQQLVFTSLATYQEQEEPWSVRFRIDVRETGVRTGVGRSEYCPPSPRDPSLERAMQQMVFGSSPRIRGGVRTRTVTMRVRVHPSGYVEEGYIRQGAPGGGTLERQLVDFVRQYSFHPARRDGTPVHGWIDVPVRVRGI